MQAAICTGSEDGQYFQEPLQLFLLFSSKAMPVVSVPIT
jgi:hypothetical protein